MIIDSIRKSLRTVLGNTGASDEARFGLRVLFADKHSLTVLNSIVTQTQLSECNIFGLYRVDRRYEIPSPLVHAIVVIHPNAQSLQHVKSLLQRKLFQSLQILFIKDVDDVILRDLAAIDVHRLVACVKCINLPFVMLFPRIWAFRTRSKSALTLHSLKSFCSDCLHFTSSFFTNVSAVASSKNASFPVDMIRINPSSQRPIQALVLDTSRYRRHELLTFPLHFGAFIYAFYNNGDANQINNFSFTPTEDTFLFDGYWKSVGEVADVTFKQFVRCIETLRDTSQSHGHNGFELTLDLKKHAAILHRHSDLMEKVRGDITRLVDVVSIFQLVDGANINDSDDIMRTLGALSYENVPFGLMLCISLILKTTEWLPTLILWTKNLDEQYPHEFDEWTGNMFLSEFLCVFSSKYKDPLSSKGFFSKVLNFSSNYISPIIDNIVSMLQHRKGDNIIGNIDENCREFLLIVTGGISFETCCAAQEAASRNGQTLYIVADNVVSFQDSSQYLLNQFSS
ncbi:hypothetical protein PCE1_003386 [Barthelona sp. PCE]